jgi:anaerobic selenocysteine-containing dehydrogenase
MENKGALGKLKRAVSSGFLGPERLLDLGLRFGPYGDKLNPFSKGLNLRRLKQAVHGIDLGALRPCLPQRLRTSNQRITLAPKAFVEDIERVRAKLSGDAAVLSNGNLLLIGRRALRSNNSWLHNSERLVKGKPQCTMLIHPEDAAERALEQGQRAVVKSRTGSTEIPIEISDQMMRGVVCIPHGWGHDRKGIQLGVAQQNAGASINDLTDNLAIDSLCGTAAFNGIPVTVDACE